MGLTVVFGFKLAGCDRLLGLIVKLVYNLPVFLYYIERLHKTNEIKLIIKAIIEQSIA